MANFILNVYADKNMNLWLNEAMTQPLPFPLYQGEGGGTFFLDTDLTTQVKIHGLEAICEGEQQEQPVEIDQASTTTAPLPPNSGFSTAHTLFLIDLMRQYLEGDCRGLPKSLAELHARMKGAKGKKKQHWMDMAAKLSSQFEETFDPDRVARKWATLEEAYKKIKDNNRTTGNGTIRFQFYEQMDILLGGKHDIDYPVVGTAEGVNIRRPEAIGLQGPELASTGPAPQPSQPTPQPSQPTPRQRRGRAEDGPFLEFLRESEAASQTRHEELLNQMKSSQQSFQTMMSKFLEKF